MFRAKNKDNNSKQTLKWFIFFNGFIISYGKSCKHCPLFYFFNYIWRNDKFF